MRKAYGIAAIALVLVMAVTLPASTAFAAQPAWGVRLGAQTWWESTGTYGVASGYPDFSGGTVYWSREVPIPYPGDLDHMVREVFFRGFVSVNHLVVLEWKRPVELGGGGSVWYMHPAANGSMTSSGELVGTAWNVGIFRIGIICKTGTLDEGWVYVDHVRCGLDATVYYDIPDWSPLPTPIPEPPEIPGPANPGTVPPINYPTLPDGGTSNPPGNLPEPGGITPLPDTPLDPVPDPEDLDPISEPDDPPDPEDIDPIPDVDDPLAPDPVPDEDDPLEPDPLPEADDPLTPDPLPDTDPLPDVDPLPEADPLPTTDPLPEADDIPELDPIPDVDDIPEADPLPTIDPLPEVDPL